MREDTDDEVAALRRRIEALELELAHERLRHREHVVGATIEAEAAHERNERLARRVTALKQQVAGAGATRPARPRARLRTPIRAMLGRARARARARGRRG